MNKHKVTISTFCLLSLGTVTGHSDMYSTGYQNQDAYDYPQGQSYYQNQNSYNYPNQGYNIQGQGYDYSQDQRNFQNQGINYSQDPYNSQNQRYNQTQRQPNRMGNPSSGFNQNYPNSANQSNQDFERQNEGQFSNYSNSPTTTRTYTISKAENQQSAVSDQDLTKKIKDKINSGWFTKRYDKVDVRVNNGNVILSGTVKTNEEKDKVEKEVRNINGVISVSSQITVQEPNRRY